MRIVLGLALVALVTHLVFGENPWQDGIAKAVRENKPIQPQDIAETWLWWMAAVNTVLLGALLTALPLWLRRVAVGELSGVWAKTSIGISPTCPTHGIDCASW